MKYCSPLLVIMLFSINSFGQISEENIKFIEETVTYPKRKNGFYKKPTDYLRNKTKYEFDNFTVTSYSFIQNKPISKYAKIDSCTYYNVTIPDSVKYHAHQMYRRSSCFVKDNVLYLKRWGMLNTYVKALIPGYFSLTACTSQPQPNNTQFGLLGAVIQERHKKPDNGSLFNMGLKRTERFTPFNFRNILSNYPKLLEEYKKDPQEGQFEAIVYYLILLNNEILKDY